MQVIDGVIILCSVMFFLSNFALLLSKDTNKIVAVFGMVLGLLPILLYAVRV